MAGISKRVSGSWVSGDYGIMKTATDTLTLPAVIYPNANSVTVGLKGNTTQSGTPTPSNPVDVVGVGELETTGEHAGEYKIPISMGGTTNNVYLGEVQTVRQIKKLVFTGQESWALSSAQTGRFIMTLANYLKSEGTITSYCTHYVAIEQRSSGIAPNNSQYFYSGSDSAKFIMIVDTSCASATDFKAYLQAQYAAGTPVTVWYVLATPTTTIVNEPLMKIGNYSDSLTTSIPVTAGENTLDVQTTVQPSEVTAAYHGWHSVQNTHVMKGLLADNPLCGISAYKDTLNLANGNCTRQVEKIELDKFTWTYTSTASYSGFYIFDYTLDLVESAGGICNKLITYIGTLANAPDNSIMVFESSGRQRLFIRYDAAEGDTTALMTMLENAVFYCVKTTPTTETITVPTGLSGTEEGYLNQSGTPTPTNPVNPTANEVRVWA